jgi:hypothetical protein
LKNRTITRIPRQLIFGDVLSGLGLAIVKAVAQRRKPDYFRRRWPDGDG